MGLFQPSCLGDSVKDCWACCSILFDQLRKTSRKPTFLLLSAEVILVHYLLFGDAAQIWRPNGDRSVSMSWSIESTCTVRWATHAMLASARKDSQYLNHANLDPDLQYFCCTIDSLFCTRRHQLSSPLMTDSLDC